MPYLIMQRKIGIGSNVDTHWNNVKLLMHMDGGFDDEKGHTITPVLASTTTGQFKYGTHSADLTAGGSKLELTHATDFLFGTSDFTMEGWIYLSSLGGYRSIFDTWNHGIGSYVVGQWGLIFDSNGRLIWDNATGASSYDRLQGNNGDITTGVWQHVAVTRSSGTVRAFVNGLIKFTGSAATTTGTNEKLTIGNGLGGYIDDVRITAGVARYTSSFTPPLSAFPDSGV